MADEVQPAAGAAAREYHKATKHSSQSVRQRAWLLDWANKPRPFKAYGGIGYVDLPRDLSEPAASALQAIATVRMQAPTTPLDLEGLARLLRYGAGIRLKRTARGGEDFWFRTYASAGALYPVETYVACSDLDGLPAGVYHFDPPNLRLGRLREGDHRGHVVRAAARDPAVAEAQVMLALTGIPWRTAWKYRERGYRHLFWDAGMIVANLLALAASARQPTRVVVGFADDELESLLGLDRGGEFPLCLVAIGRSEEVKPAEAPADPISFRVMRLSATEYVFQAIGMVNNAGRLAAEEVRRWRSRLGQELELGQGRPVARGPSADSMAEVIMRRGSSRRFGRKPMPKEVLESILTTAAGGVPTDYAPSGFLLVEPYLIANDVNGLAMGAYVWREGELRPLKEGDFREEAGYLCLEQELGGTAAATHFLMADLERILEAGGDRGYRAAQLEAGIVAGKMYLAAYAQRFGATGLTFYDDQVTEFLSPDAAGKSCMLVVAVGESTRAL